MFKLLHILGHLGRVTVASGKKRLYYAIIHTLMVAAAIALGLFAYYAIVEGAISFATELGKGIGLFIGASLAIVIGIFFVIEGVIGQVWTFLTAFFGIIVSKTRLANLFAFLIAGASLALGIYGVYALIPVVNGFLGL